MQASPDLDEKRTSEPFRVSLQDAPGSDDHNQAAVSLPENEPTHRDAEQPRPQQEMIDLRLSRTLSPRLAEKVSASLARRSSADLVNTYKRRHERVVKTRFTNSSQRMDIHYQWTNVQHTIRHLQSSVDALVDLATSDKVVSSNKRHKVKIKKQASTVLSTNELINGQLRDVHLLLTELQEHDLLLDKTEHSFDNAARILFNSSFGDESTDDIDLISDVSLLSSPNDPFRSLQTPATPIAPQLELYFDTVGNVKIMRERLVELHTERREQQERRGLLVDQERELDQTDEQFEQHWKQELRDADTDLREARSAMDDARNACEALQIAIPTWATITPSISEIDHEHSDNPNLETISPPNSIPERVLSQDGLKSITMATGPLMWRDESPTKTPPPSHPYGNERITSWIDSVQPATFTTTQSRGVSQTRRPQATAAERPADLMVRKVKSLSALTPKHKPARLLKTLKASNAKARTDTPETPGCSPPAEKDSPPDHHDGDD